MTTVKQNANCFTYCFYKTAMRSQAAFHEAINCIKTVNIQILFSAPADNLLFTTKVQLRESLFTRNNPDGFLNKDMYIHTDSLQ